jgi:hypothetical protein
VEEDERFRAAGDTEPSGFIWHESYTKALLKLPTRELQTEFLFGVIAYGSYGTEPFFEYPLDMVFEGIRPNIDCSKKRVAAGKKGGRPSKDKSG